MTLIALKQICDQLKEAIGLDDEHNVAALIDEDCDTEVKGWTIVSVSNSGEIKPCTSQSFSTIKELMYSWLEKQGEQKSIIIPKFRVGDTIRVKNSNAEYLITDISGGCYHGKGWGLDIVAGDKDYELIKQKPAEWSEEDEKHIHSIISTIECCKAQYKEAIAVIEQYDSDLDWLKSLKDRYTWKPSDEQMDALLSEVTAWTKGCPKQIVLESLYNDLKKLKS